MAPAFRVVINDTIGHARWLPDAFRFIFPQVDFFFHATSGTREEKRPHPHAVMVASRYLLPLMDAGQGEVHFVGFLADPGESHIEALSIKEGIIKKHGPITEDINSWGADRALDPALDAISRRYFGAYVEREAYLRQKYPYTAVYAAGNTDRPGMDDVGHPGRSVKGALVAGALDRHGRVTPWTSDGQAVTCSLWGDQVYVYDPFELAWVPASGTSFAAPSLAGLVAYYRLGGQLTPETAEAWLVEHATPLPDGREHHPKAGAGSVEDLHSAILTGNQAMDRAGILASARQAQTLGGPRGPRWHDFRQLQGEPWPDVVLPGGQGGYPGNVPE